MEAVYEQIHYAPAVRVGRTIDVSGQVGRDEQMRIVEGSEAQIVQAFENLRRVLEAGAPAQPDSQAAGGGRGRGAARPPRRRAEVAVSGPSAACDASFAPPARGRPSDARRA